MAECDVCSLPDPYNGGGDGIGSCDCPRCDCGEAGGSAFCTCEDGYPWPVEPSDDEPYRPVTDVQDVKGRL